MQLSENVLRKFLKYNVVGFVCTAIYFLTMYFLVEVFNEDPVYGAVISFIVMTIFSFLLNKKYTFGGTYSHQQFIRFMIVAAIGFTLNFGIMYTLINVLLFHYLIGEFVTILIIPLVNFTLNYLWTFK